MNKNKLLDAPKILVILAMTMLSSNSFADHGSGSHIDVNLAGPVNSNTGNYSVTWTNNSDPNLDETQYLQQKYNGGSYISVYSGTGGSVLFTGKPNGTYNYRVRWEFCFGFFCFSQYSAPITIIVDDTLPPADSDGDQLMYEYDLRTGDFDGNGYVDILIDRITPGIVDGSMQTVIVGGTTSGPTVFIPTQSELNSARTYPVNSNITLGGFDHNVDGYTDLQIIGLATLNSAAFPYDCLIVFASGNYGIAQPLGHKFIDEDYMEFFDNIRSALEDPNFYADNTLVIIRPVFTVVIDCPFQFDPFSGFSLWSCHFGIVVEEYVSQVIGIGYHASAPDATDAINAILVNDDFLGGIDWWNLSVALESILGVHSFGFRIDGSRGETNYGDDGIIESEFGEIIFAFLGYYYEESTPITSVEVRHDYDFPTNICSTTSDTPYGGVSIPQSDCTEENVQCWSQRRPAPRLNGSEDTVLKDQNITLKFGMPIKVHTYDFINLKLLVNTTRKGHVFHDDMMVDEDCAHDIVTIGAYPDRCSYVHRMVSLNGNWVKMHTHGEGWNNSFGEKVLNELAGEYIFKRVDDWIKGKLAFIGACTDS